MGHRGRAAAGIVRHDVAAPHRRRWPLGVTLALGALGACSNPATPTDSATSATATATNRAREAALSVSTRPSSFPPLPSSAPRSTESCRSRGLVWTEDHSLASSSPDEGDVFGYAVALYSGTALVTAPSNPVQGVKAGKLSVFAPSGGDWLLAQELTASDGFPGDTFGWSLSVDGDTALVGATYDPLFPLLPQPGPGAVYVLGHDVGGWSEQTKLVGNDPAKLDAFGMAVSASGDTAAVGAPYDDALGPASGAAYVFVRTGGVWSLQQRLAAGDAASGAQFGSAVGLSGDTLLVGARGDPTAGTVVGAVYVFQRSGASWSEQQVLHASDQAAGDGFGWALALQGDRAVVGAPSNPTLGAAAGAAYRLERNGNAFAELQKLAPGDGGTGDQLGFAVSLRDDVALVGAVQVQKPGGFPGHVSVFGPQGDSWGETARLESAEAGAGSAFGRATAHEPSLAIIGAPMADNLTGAAYVFVHTKHGDGDPCVDGSSCASGLCVDGVCCDGACGGGATDDCQACSVAAGAQTDGTCGPRPNGAACEDGSICNGADQCQDGACNAHPAPPCPGPDGDADCFESCVLQGSSYQCDGYDGEGTACQLGACTGGECLRSLGAPCSAPLECQSGLCVDQVCCLAADCAPLRCGPLGACLTSCASSSDCQPGTQCSSAGQCVPALGADALPDGTGCSCVAARRARLAAGHALLAALGLSALFARRRRRRREPPTANRAARCAALGSNANRLARTLAALVLLLLGACSSDRSPSLPPIERATLGSNGSDGAGGPARSRGLVWTQEQKLIGSHAQIGDVLGVSVALHGDTAMLGAPNNPLTNLQGSAYVFGRTGAGWTEQQRLLASDGQHADGFGFAVAFDGDWAVVGRTMDPTLAPDYPEPGAVYFFERTGNGWSESHKFVAYDGAVRDSFGFGVALDNATAVVGAPDDDDVGPDAGTAYVLVRNGSSWGLQQKLVPADASPFAHFGWAVALHGDTVLVGAPYDSEAGLSAGAAYVYQRTGSSWSQQQKLYASDATTYQDFGIAVALDGDTAVVGSPEYNAQNNAPGAAYVFVRSDSSWSQQQKLVPSDGAANDLFGDSIALQGDTAVIGADQTVDYTDPHPGKAYVFARSGTSWSEQTRLSATPEANSALGRAVALDGTRLLLGAPGDAEKAMASGAGFVFALKSDQGDPCVAGTECASGYCVDGVCCDGECGGDDPADCLVCSVAAGAQTEGVCAPRPDEAPCDDRLYCNGADRCLDGACALHGDDPCPGPDQDGDCRESCDEQTAACTAPDPDGASCADGICGSGVCRQELGGACADASGCQSGFCVIDVCCVQAECGAYRCAADGACLATCATTADCAPGQQCSSAGQCVAAIGPDLAPAGCSCSLAPRSEPRLRGWLALLLLLGVTGGRRVGRRRRLLLGPVLVGVAACHGDALPDLVVRERSAPASHAPSPSDPAESVPERSRSLEWAQDQRLSSPQAQLGDLMGWVLALDGDTALVGVPSNAFAGTRQGSVLVFGLADGAWSERQLVTASDGWVGDGFGYAVALQGDTALVGATMPPYYAPAYPGPGAAYVLVREGGSWHEQQKLQGASGQPLDTFGIAVALDGDTAVVGAPFDDDYGASSGSVYVFVREGGSWTEQQRLATSDESSGDRFGHSVSLDGDTLVAGATLANDPATTAGAAYVFVRSGASWTEQQKLTAPDGIADSNLGVAVAVQGDTAIAGAPGDADLGANAGAAYVFVRSGTSWTLQQKLLPHDGKAHDNFGEAISLRGDTVVLDGTATPDLTSPGPGAAYLFVRSGTSWTEQQKLVAEPPANYSLGHGVSLGPTQLLVGAPGDSTEGVAAGSVFVFAQKSTNGDPCTSPEQCVSGFCVDSMCCDSECGHGDPGDCLVCSAAAGAPADGNCGPLGDGTACDDGLFCNGADRCASGQCALHGLDPCPGPDQDDDCRESCSELDHGCTAPDPDGSSCTDGSCGDGVCQKGLGGSCLEASGCQSGYCVVGVCCVQADCDAYGCDPHGACLGSCLTTGDCAPGFQCSSARQCVPGLGSDAADGPGCSCATPGFPRPASAKWVLGALLGARRLRRRSG